MADRFDRITNTIAVLGAVVTVFLLARRELRPESSNRSTSSPAEFVEDWREMLPDSSEIRDKQIVIVEFSDLECPFCREFHTTLQAVEPKLRGRLHHEFLHYPIPAHRLAMPAARAVECARREGRANEMIDVLFAQQDSLGVKPWSELAAQALVADEASFLACTRSNETDARIQRDVSLGQRLGVRGTPTVLVNGWRFAGTPREPLFSQVISDLMEGRNPFP